MQEKLTGFHLYQDQVLQVEAGTPTQYIYFLIFSLLSSLQSATKFSNFPLLIHMYILNVSNTK